MASSLQVGGILFPHFLSTGVVRAQSAIVGLLIRASKVNNRLMLRGRLSGCLAQPDSTILHVHSPLLEITCKPKMMQTWNLQGSILADELQNTLEACYWNTWLTKVHVSVIPSIVVALLTNNVLGSISNWVTQFCSHKLLGCSLTHRP